MINYLGRLNNLHDESERHFMTDILKDYKRYFKSIPKNITLYYIILLIAAITSSAFSIIFGIYLKNLGYSEEIVGGILSLMTLGIGIGAIPVTVLSDRFNRRNTICLGLVIMLIMGLIMVNCRILWVIQSASFVFGVGQAAVMILQTPILYENTPDEDRVTAFSMAFVLQNVAFIFSSFILGHASSLLTKRFDAVLANVYVLNSATLLLAVAIFASLKFSGKSLVATSREVSFKTTLTDTINGYKSVLNGPPALYVLQVALIGFGAGMIVPFFSIYLKYTLAISDGTVGTIMSISQVGTIIGGLIVAPLSKRLGRVKTVLICQLLSIPFLLSISLPQGLVIITISFFFRSSLMNMAGPIINSLSMDIVNEQSRTHMSSVVSMTSNLFRAFGIYVGGYVMYTFSYNTPYYLTIICYLIGTAVFYRLFHEKK